MRKFMAVVVGVVALGLTLRFALNNSAPSKPRAPVQQPASNQPAIPDPGGTPTPTTSPPTPIEGGPTPAEPAPPRIAGSTQISSASVRHFAAAPGVIYYCDQRDLMMQPKIAGARAERVGDCSISSDLVADREAVFYCADDKLMRITAGTTGSHVVAEMECIMMALDARYAYFVRPGFDSIPDPGVYRVERGGGTPERIHQRNKEQFGIVVDDEAIWISSYFTGTIQKLGKTPGAKPRMVVTGQKNLEDFGVDATYLYWFPEGSNEVRRRKKSGGAIEVIGRNVVSYPLKVIDGHAYWFERIDGASRLMHLAPGVLDVEVLATGLHTPWMTVDSEGVYVSELDRDGIFMFKR